jgi:hypothetical protein
VATDLEQQAALVERELLLRFQGLLLLMPAAVVAQYLEQDLITQAGQAGQAVAEQARQTLLLAVAHIFQRWLVL